MSVPGLSDLATKINTAHEAAFGHAKAAVLRAIDVGDLLTQAKAQLKHGEWTPWVEANCRFGVRQAQKYLRAYELRESLAANANSCSHLPATIDSALASLADGKHGGSRKPSRPGRKAAPDVQAVRPGDLKRSSLRFFGVDPIDSELVDKIRESIREDGFRGAVLCRRMPDGSIEIVDGHHRVEAAKAEGVEVIDVTIADLDDDDAIKAMARSQATQTDSREDVHFGVFVAMIGMSMQGIPVGGSFSMAPAYELGLEVFGLGPREVSDTLETIEESGFLGIAGLAFRRADQPPK